MKKLLITSILTILTLPAFADDASNPFANAKTADEAWGIFETESQNILNKYKSQLKNKEFKKLTELRQDLLENKPATSAEISDEKSQTNEQDKDKNTQAKDTKEKKQKGKVKRELTEEEKEQKLNELRDNAKAMKDKEQSTENKLLGAAGIGATGIGGMQLASAMSEQNADQDAEMAMKAYLATFTCKYGDKRVNGGEVDVALPGGNELVSLYTEYVTLANDLKVRKNALGIKPGIEAEAILDSATTGLYDDVGVGKTSGAYASLARALQDPEGEDAKMWAAQKEETAKKLKTGAITAGVGAVGSLIGNLAINAKAPKEKSADIKRKYSKLQDSFKEIEKEVEQLPTPKCSDINGANGTYPDCKCNGTNTYLDTNQGKCITCPDDQIVQGDTCVPKGCELTGITKEGQCACAENTKQNGKQCECTLTGVVTDCTCGSNATKNNDNKCECNDGFDEKTENGITTCVEKVVIQAEEIASISLKADTLFDSNQYNITDPKKEDLVGKIWKAIQEKNPDATNEILKETCITLTGHADWTGKSKSNQTLSENRANAVKDVLIEQSGNVLSDDNFIVSGKGEDECPEKNNKTEPQKAACRRVDVKIITGACDGFTPPALENIAGALSGVKTGAITK